ncbi:MAG: hypothetical protein DRP49_03820 [Spirochaetes bacterium]|nr:MAG: hypothetical protein DRP49_03820 [Spirochaetota bacterium]
MSMKDYEVTASLNTEQFMSLQNELRKLMTVEDVNRFTQFILQTHGLHRIKGRCCSIQFHFSLPPLT